MSGKTNKGLMSFSTTGSIGNAWTFSKFKSCGYVKTYATPTISQAPQSVSARKDFSILASAWSNIFNKDNFRKAWSLFIDFLEKPQTPYNSFIRHAGKLRQIHPSGAVMDDFSWDGNEMEINFLTVDRGLKATETGYFDIWMKTANASWVLLNKSILVDGIIDVDLTDLPDNHYQIKIVKDGINRTGTMKVRKPIH